MDITDKFTDSYFLKILQKTFKSRRITDEMCRKIKVIRVIDKDIKNLSGIEYFPNLEYLNIAYNDVQRLDLSLNMKLQELYCYKNNIKTIILPDRHMRVVSVYGNSKSLNLQKCLADRVIIEERQLVRSNTHRKNKLAVSKPVKII
jgi:hypothetical protein